MIDPKAEFLLPECRIVDDPNKLNRLSSNDRRPIIYAPRPEYYDPAIYDKVFRWIWERKHTTCYIDELLRVIRAGRTTEWLQALFVTGRSRNIRTIAATQRPHWIPLEVLTEAEHYFCFKLNMLTDRQRMAELMTPAVLHSPEREFSFWYYYNKRPKDGAKQFIIAKPKRATRRRDV